MPERATTRRAGSRGRRGRSRSRAAPAGNKLLGQLHRGLTHHISYNEEKAWAWACAPAVNAA
jgi:hypothetical protein